MLLKDSKYVRTFLSMHSSIRNRVVALSTMHPELDFECIVSNYRYVPDLFILMPTMQTVNVKQLNNELVEHCGNDHTGKFVILPNHANLPENGYTCNLHDILGDILLDMTSMFNTPELKNKGGFY